MINSWSHSRITDFEKCKFLAWLKHDQKIPEPERPLPPGKTEHANDRGTRIHNHAECFVRGDVSDQIPEMGKFIDEFDKLRRLHALGMVSLEGEWGLDRKWQPTEYRSAWHRSKIDALVLPNPHVGIVIDYKSGKKFGNEIKHGEQTQLYALNTVLRYPLIEEITTELWYLDIGELTSVTFTRAQILRFQRGWDMRGSALTSATVFPPNPNIYSCQYCQYGPWNGGQCKVGVKRGTTFGAK